MGNCGSIWMSEITCSTAPQSELILCVAEYLPHSTNCQSLVPPPHPAANESFYSHPCTTDLTQCRLSQPRSDPPNRYR